MVYSICQGHRFFPFKATCGGRSARSRAQDLFIFTADGIGRRPFRREVVEELAKWQAPGSDGVVGPADPGVDSYVSCFGRSFQPHLFVVVMFFRGNIGSPGRSVAADLGTGFLQLAVVQCLKRDLALGAPTAREMAVELLQIQRDGRFRKQCPNLNQSKCIPTNL